MGMGSQKRKMFVGLSFALVAAGALVAYGCSDDEVAATDTGADAGGTSKADSASAADTGGPTPQDSGSALARARANIKPTTDGGTVNGTAQFEALASGGARVTIAISGATPGLHGIHIHPIGDCGDAGVGAGGHWTAVDAGHGYPDAAVHHTGDLGNITIAANGTGSLVLENRDWTITPGTYSVVGRAVIFHAGTDDGVSQPTGDAGARPGCGVIVLE